MLFEPGGIPGRKLNTKTKTTRERGNWLLVHKLCTKEKTTREGGNRSTIARVYVYVLLARNDPPATLTVEVREWFENPDRAKSGR